VVEPPDYALASNKSGGKITNKEFQRSRERSNLSKKQVRAWEYNMTGHAASCVEKYLDLLGVDASSLKHVAHPCIDDHQLSDDDYNTKGQLSPVAARIVHKILYFLDMINQIPCGQ